MKKTICAVVACVLMLSLMLTGCGGSGIPSELVGTWKMTSAESAGITMTVEATKEGNKLVLKVDESTVYLEKSGSGLESETGSSDGASEKTDSSSVSSSSAGTGNSSSVGQTSSSGAVSGMTVSQKNAFRSAKSYLNYSAFSYTGLIGQLEYEGFTHEQAVYGAAKNGY